MTLKACPTGCGLWITTVGRHEHEQTRVYGGIEYLETIPLDSWYAECRLGHRHLIENVVRTNSGLDYEFSAVPSDD